MTSPGGGRAAIQIVGDVSNLGAQLQRDTQKAVDHINLDTDTISEQLTDGVQVGVDGGIEALQDLEQAAEEVFSEIGIAADQAGELIGDFSSTVSLSSKKIVTAIDEAGREVTRTFNTIARDGKVTTTLVEKSFDEAGDQVERTFKAVGEAVQDVGDLVKQVAAQAAESTTGSFEDVGKRLGAVFGNARRVAKAELTQVADVIEDVGDAVAETERKSRPLSKVFTGISNSLVAVGESLVAIGVSAPTPAGLLSILAALVAIVALTGPVLALGGALADLVGLVTVIPAAIGVLLVSVAAITIAFQGFGDAIGAVIDGDPEKIAEALEKLAPAAQSVVKEFQKLLPQFRELGDAVQQSFFAPLVGNLTILSNATLPTLQTGLSKVAESIGRAGSNFAEFLSEPEQVETLNALLGTTSRVIDSVAVGASNLGQALFKAMGAALPQVEQLGSALGEGLTKFAAFISESVEDGSFQEFFEDAVKTLGKLVDLGGALGELLGALFGETDDEGRDFLTTLTDLVQRMTEFFKSAEGKDALNDLVEQIKTTATIIGYLVNAFLFIIGVFGAIDDAIAATISFFNDLGNTIIEFWNGLVTTVEDAAVAVLGFLGETIEDIVNFFKELPGRIGDFISSAIDFLIEKITSIPGLIVAAFDQALDNVIAVVGLAIATVIVIFTELPGQILGALEYLKNLAVEAFVFIRDKVVEITIAIVEYVKGLPAKLGDLFNQVKDRIVAALTTALEFLSTIPGRIRDFFQSAKDQASNKIGEFVALVKGLPGRIMDAIGDLGQLLYTAGQKVINGLIGGIKSRVGQLRDTIANAVQEIRDHLPFSPAKVGPLSGGGSPQIAGATIAEMIAAGIDSQIDEIAAAAARAAGSAVLPDLGVSPFQDTAGPPLVGPTTGPQPSPLGATDTTTGQQPVFLIQIGDEEIEAFITKVVQEQVQVETRRLMNGVRS